LYSVKLTPSVCWRVPVASPGAKPRRVIEFSQRLGAVSYQSFGKDWLRVYVSTLPRPVWPGRAYAGGKATVVAGSGREVLAAKAYWKNRIAVG
jgi:hypothetical protein